MTLTKLVISRGDVNGRWNEMEANGTRNWKNKKDETIEIVLEGIEYYDV